MQDDPARYWQDLTENYRQMSDGELLELWAKPEDLTEIARQVLCDEMNRRKIEVRKPSQPTFVRPPVDYDPSTHFYSVGGPFRDHHAPVPDCEETDDETPRAYTWKALLCDCESNDHAWCLFETLKRHGIESWVRQVSAASTDLRGPQVYVAADELEQAQAIAAQPIPQDIIDDWNQVVPEFELPICPQCGSKEGATLESADPVNAWVCEACGAEWTDPAAAAAEDGSEEESSAP